MGASLVVWKYPIEFNRMLACLHFSLPLPAGAKALYFDMQEGVPTLWALVDGKAAKEPRDFMVVDTGQPILSLPEGRRLAHIGTCLEDGGEYVCHLFEVVGAGSACPGCGHSECDAKQDEEKIDGQATHNAARPE